MAAGFRLRDRITAELTTTSATPVSLVTYAVPTDAEMRMVMTLFLQNTVTDELWGATYYNMWKNRAGTASEIVTTGTWDQIVGLAETFTNDPTIVPASSGANAVVTVTPTNTNSHKWFAYVDFYVR